MLCDGVVSRGLVATVVNRAVLSFATQPHFDESTSLSGSARRTLHNANRDVWCVMARPVFTA